MIERFLLDRIALNAGHVTERHFKLTCVVEAHFANAPPAVADKATVAARNAADPVAFRLAKLRSPCHGVPVKQSR